MALWVFLMPECKQYSSNPAENHCNSCLSCASTTSHQDFNIQSCQISVRINLRKFKSSWILQIGLPEADCTNVWHNFNAFISRLPKFDDREKSSISRVRLGSSRIAKEYKLFVDLIAYTGLAWNSRQSSIPSFFHSIHLLRKCKF